VERNANLGKKKKRKKKKGRMSLYDRNSDALVGHKRGGEKGFLYFPVRKRLHKKGEKVTSDLPLEGMKQGWEKKKAMANVILGKRKKKRG